MTFWTPERTQALVEMRGRDVPHAEVARQIGHSERAVKSKAAREHVARPVSDFWTPERVAKLNELAPGGMSCSQIAAELGNCTRNMVIGKLSRMKVVRPGPVIITKRAKRKPGDHGGGLVTKLKKQARAAMKRSPRPRQPWYDFTKPAAQPASETAVRFIDRRSFQCAAILDDEAPIGERMCCGATVLDGKAWCEWHARVFFAPPRER